MGEGTNHTATEGNREKIPIDAKLLSDAIIELNISRRSVGLYPREHPITRESIERAFGFLGKLFEFRNSITLGIAKDSLIIDDNILDRKNPVFREFALSLHGKGIAAVSFRAGTTLEELLDLHEIIISKDPATGKTVAELAERKGLHHIMLIPLDVSRLSFAEGRRREDDVDIGLWENYVSGLVEGKLADSDAEGLILNAAPEDIALFVNKQVPSEAADETYDRVITSYLRRKEHPGIRSEFFSRFLSLVSNLSPELKQQFLRRALSHPSVEAIEAEKLLGELSPRDIEKITAVLKENPSIIPDSVRNLLDKLKSTQTEGDFFEKLSHEKKAFFDDIEIDQNITDLLEGDHFKSFVNADYQNELDRMMSATRAPLPVITKGLGEELRDGTIERRFAEIALELLDADSRDRDDYLASLTRISEFAEDFLETGRFSEVSEIYNVVYTQSLAGRFRDEAGSMIEYFFRSEAFIDKFMDAIRLWGRHDREGVFRLANVQKRHLLDRLFEALAAEEDASIRKFYLQLLSAMGSDVAEEAAKRLDDDRWYVLRNMIYLLREAGGVKYANYIRKFAKNKNGKICVEAVKALLDLKTPDAFSHIRLQLQSRDPRLREQAIKLAGVHRCSDAVPDLVDMLRKRDLFGTESYYRIPAVRALGEIGDPAAIDALVKLCRSTTLLYRSSFEELKVEIFRSLKNYPRERIAPLLDIGMKSRNEEIRSITCSLLRGGEDNAANKGL
ncbi:MAG: HEAT repeat domain-containing protein [Nitrospiraceae bacterium]|nr:HEAT repeat domain-containing protein [Nitrospiraceae bacterium]